MKALLPLATVFAGLGLTAAPPVAAQTAGEAPVADPCVAAFADSARTNRNLGMQTSQPPGSDAIPGTEIRLEGVWAPSMWETVTALSACVEVAGDVDPNLGGVEEPPVNDGSFSHLFNVPAGLNNGTVICTRVRLAGDPAGEATSGEWISRQACFEVNPEPAETPTTTAPAPAPAPTTPTTSPPATSPPATSPPTTATTIAAAPPAVPAPRPAPAPVQPTPEPPAQRTVAFGTPDDEPVVSADTPRPRRPTVPVAMPELPRTGAPTPVGPLTLAGVAAIGTGLPLALLRRRR